MTHPITFYRSIPVSERLPKEGFDVFTFCHPEQQSKGELIVNHIMIGDGRWFDYRNSVKWWLEEIVTADDSQLALNEEEIKEIGSTDKESTEYLSVKLTQDKLLSKFLPLLESAKQENESLKRELDEMKEKSKSNDSKEPKKTPSPIEVLRKLIIQNPGNEVEEQEFNEREKNGDFEFLQVAMEEYRNA